MPEALSEEATRILEYLTKDLEIGGARKFDNANGVFMAVCIDRLTSRHFSVAHYYEQNGDLMADPDMTFFRRDNGEFYACTFQQDNLGIYRVGLEIDEDGTIEEEDVQEQNDQAEFANGWMKNIAEQQELPIELAPGGDR